MDKTTSSATHQYKTVEVQILEQLIEVNRRLERLQDSMTRVIRLLEAQRESRPDRFSSPGS